MIRILIADDQNLVQQGIKSLLERDMEFKVVGTVEDGRDAIKQIAQLHPDIVLLDIEMPGMNGITTTKHIARVSPKTKVIILSSHEGKKYVMAALMAGAKGYLLKTSLMTDLKQAILAVNNGYSQIDSRLLAKVFDRKNIKAKQTYSNRKDNPKNKKDLQFQRDSITVKNQKKQSKNVIDLKQETNQKPFQPLEQPVEIAESVVAKSQAILPSKKIESKLSTSEITPISAVRKVVNFSPDIPDSTTLKQTDKEISGDRSDGSNKSLLEPPPAINQTALTTVVENSSLKQYKFPAHSSKSNKKNSPISKYLAKFLDNPKISPYKPQIAKLKSRSIEYQTKLKFLIKQKQKQDLLRNLGFVLLGALVVIILGKI